MHLVKWNYTSAKDYLQKLIDVAYQEPKIYSDMSEIYKIENNFEKALEFIKLGRKLFGLDLRTYNRWIKLLFSKQ